MALQHDRNRDTNSENPPTSLGNILYSTQQHLQMQNPSPRYSCIWKKYIKEAKKTLWSETVAGSPVFLFLCLYVLSGCDGLTLARCHVPTKLLYHSPPQLNEERKHNKKLVRWDKHGGDHSPFTVMSKMDSTQGNYFIN